MVRRAAAIAFAAGMVAGAAQGADLRIGVSEAATTIDPHHHFVRANNEIRHHIFQSLTWLDRNGRLWPLLATKWEPISDTTWRFKLRKKVNFHDGSPLVARDVVYTLCRILATSDGPSPFTLFTGAIESVKALIAR